MTTPSMPMTPTDLIAASSSVLEAGGYQPIRNGFPEWNTTSTRLFEDKYNVVGIAVFTTSAELLSSWADLQGALVDVISRHVGQTESKAWDGYLVLLTTGIAPSSDAEIEGLRYDTTRLRKLVATGEDLSAAGDVERLLRPLLPLRTAQVSIAQGTALDLLPGLLAEQGINAKTTEALVKSFIEQEPLMDALHRQRRSQ
jgi:hypothetical protein